jgi:DNA-binding NtrC family response regulator
MRRRGPRFDERRSRDINRVKSDTGAILIVDDDPAQRRIVREIFGAGHMPVREASGGAEAVEIALPDRSGKGGSPLISLVVLDLNMPGMGGMEALEAIHAGSPDLPILVLTADGSVTRAVEAMRAGAQDYLIKPVSPQRLLTTARTLLQVSSLTGEVRRLRGERPNAGGLAGLVAESAAIRAAIEQAQKAAASSIPVMIGGESGVGKEIFARAIHADSLRSAAPFVAVNCGALPKDLIESILFGHEKGAFTGATERRQGKFREADGGTLFLDEVGDLPPEAQVKLLRAIQEHEIDPVGGKGGQPVDVRIISATNRDLEREVAAKRFRQDLFYRLSVFPLALPSLRERREDIGPLAHLFQRRIAREEGRPAPGVTPEARALLAAHDWPGNVRELENAVYRAVVMSEGGNLDVGDFPQIPGGRGPSAPRPEAPAAARNGAGGPAAASLRAAPAQPIFIGADGHILPLEEIEAAALRAALERYSGNISEVSRRLGVGRSTLYRKLREIGAEQPGR